MERKDVQKETAIVGGAILDFCHKNRMKVEINAGGSERGDGFYHIETRGGGELAAKEGRRIFKRLPGLWLRLGILKTRKRGMRKR